MKKQYMSYEESTNFLHTMEKKYPDLLNIIKIGSTFEGRDIILVKISKDVEKADEKPAMLYTGNIHAREWIGHELGLKFIEYIAKNQNIDPELERSLEDSAIYMVPCLNPDGYEYSRKHFSFWRKNRRVNHDGTIGVDLNRNFSIGFEKNNNTNSNVYGGEEPFSEAETRAIKDFVDTHPNITISFDYHSQGNVFFPAHNFKHEAELNGTDINVLCANMNDEIEKTTGRKYGIHRGKPPAALIAGSGREYYYSRGALATVVEVGTKNIPDYMKSMSSSIHENIPALKKAFTEVINYSAMAPKRVDNFTIGQSNANSVVLTWEYEARDDIFFEIYRSVNDKDACNERTKVAITGGNSYSDQDLDSSTNYHYTIRAVNKKTGYKSPFAPIVKVRTSLEVDEFFKLIFASKSGTGYVGQYTQEQNRAHFGDNSLFVGVNSSKGVCDAVISFDLATLPDNAIIKSARFYLYPMNRVAAKIEKYGEWNVSLLENNSFSDITDFNSIDKAPSKGIIGQAIQSSRLTQGIWDHWEFTNKECDLLQEEIAHKKAVFRVDGPKDLPNGEDSQMMQFDIGYGNFGGGIHYRPILDIKYTVKKDKSHLKASVLTTISKNSIDDGLRSGFDEDKNKVYGYLNFDLSRLPDSSEHVITSCVLKMKNRNTFKKRTDIRFYVEIVELEGLETYQDIENREMIEYVGYEVSESDLSSKRYQYFKFDTLSKITLDDLHQNSKILQMVIKPTSSSGAKNHITRWDSDLELIVKTIPKKRTAPKKVENLSITKENRMIKLSWDDSDKKNTKGYYVVRNSFHPPRHFMDGVKLYGGGDTYTYDNYASFDKEKFYSIFSYDEVPNFSEATSIRYNPQEKY